MAVEVTMPKLGLTMEQGTVLNWNKGVGDPVETGEVLLTIQTDKVEFEVEAPAGGTVLKLLANEGDVVPTGEVIAFIGAAGEEVDAAAPAPSAPAAPPPPGGTPTGKGSDRHLSGGQKAGRRDGGRCLDARRQRSRRADREGGRSQGGGRGEGGGGPRRAPARERTDLHLPAGPEAGEGAGD